MPTHISAFVKMASTRPYILSIVLFAICSHLSAQEFTQDNEVFTRKGCKFETGKAHSIYTETVVNPITAETITKTRNGPAQPSTVNGHKVYSEKEATTPPQNYPGAKSLEAYLLDSLAGDSRLWLTRNIVARLDLQSVIVDEKGRVVYFEYAGIKAWTKNGVRDLNDNLALKINRLMSNAPAMKPATVNGKNVTAYSCVFLQDYAIDAAARNVTWRKDPLNDIPGEFIKTRRE